MLQDKLNHPIRILKRFIVPDPDDAKSSHL